MRLIKPVALSALIVLGSCEKDEPQAALITTLAATDITAYSATVGGELTLGDDLPVVSRGICWSRFPDPTLADNCLPDGNEPGVYTRQLSDLSADQTYYVRAYYSTARDTVYAPPVEFITQDYIQFNPGLTYGTVTDIDGNVYKTITIGTQTWMAENLRTTRFQNGDPLPNIPDPASWSSFGEKEGAYCFFEYDDAKSEIYGAYYDWFAASDPRNLAPEGWHVATEEDWETLQAYCSYTFGEEYAYALRETTTAHWQNDLISAATNETGFTALAANRALTLIDADWYRGGNAYFWTSSGSADIPMAVWLRENISITPDQTFMGYSIRCVKD